MKRRQISLILFLLCAVGNGTPLTSVEGAGAFPGLDDDRSFAITSVDSPELDEEVLRSLAAFGIDPAKITPEQIEQIKALIAAHGQSDDSAGLDQKSENDQKILELIEEYAPGEQKTLDEIRESVGADGETDKELLAANTLDVVKRIHTTLSQYVETPHQQKIALLMVFLARQLHVSYNLYRLFDGQPGLKGRRARSVDDHEYREDKWNLPPQSKLATCASLSFRSLFFIVFSVVEAKRQVEGLMGTYKLISEQRNQAPLSSQLTADELVSRQFRRAQASLKAAFSLLDDPKGFDTLNRLIPGSYLYEGSLHVLTALGTATALSLRKNIYPSMKQPFAYVFLRMTVFSLANQCGFFVTRKLDAALWGKLSPKEQEVLYHKSFGMLRSDLITDLFAQATPAFRSYIVDKSEKFEYRGIGRRITSFLAARVMTALVCRLGTAAIRAGVLRGMHSFAHKIGTAFRDKRITRGNVIEQLESKIIGFIRTISSAMSGDVAGMVGIDPAANAPVTPDAHGRFCAAAFPNLLGMSLRRALSDEEFVGISSSLKEVFECDIFEYLEQYKFTEMVFCAGFAREHIYPLTSYIYDAVLTEDQRVRVRTVLIEEACIYLLFSPYAIFGGGHAYIESAVQDLWNARDGNTEVSDNVSRLIDHSRKAFSEIPEPHLRTSH